jgi:hypothetical protein
MNKVVKKFLAVTVLSAAAPFASAGILNFDFTSAGVGYASDTCGSSCYEITTQGLAYETGGIPGLNAWSFEGVMQFIDFGIGGFGAGIDGANGGWRFDDLFGNDSLWGSFATVLGANDAGVISYAIEGGSGLFSGAFGSGSSSFAVTGGSFPKLFSYYESGSMRVAVTEPGVLSLFALGLIALALATRRRRLRIGNR